jgi:AcrR family transcriptional regulator
VTEATRRVPRTGRGERTRDELLAAATEVFWDKGYVDARVADIAERAGVSHGTFYTYFDSKEAVLWALAADFNEAMSRSTRGVRAEVGGDEVRAIELANRRFLQLYLDNRKVMRLMEEVAAFNPEMRKARQATRSRFVAQTTHSIERMQAAGLVDPGLDATYAAHALVSMVSHFAYHVVATRLPLDLDKAVATLTAIWARGLGLDPDPRRDPDPGVTLP